MSDSDKFTEADAENDGLIKREAGTEMAKQAKRSAPQLWGMFQSVCEEMGRDPDEVLGDHIVRALKDQAHAEAIFDTEIDMSSVQQDQMSIEDAKFIKTMMDELGVNREQSKDPIDRFMEKRMESINSTPLSRIRGQGRRETDPEVESQLAEIKQEIESMKKQAHDATDDTQDSTERRDIDEVFEETGDEEDDEPEQEEMDIDDAFEETQTEGDTVIIEEESTETEDENFLDASEQEGTDGPIDSDDDPFSAEPDMEETEETEDNDDGE